MISMDELLNGKYQLEDQTEEIQNNLNILLERVNQIRTLWGQPMKVTSGLRTMEDHIRIYTQKAAAAGVPFDMSKVPMGSRHLTGGAVDVYDPDLSLTAWLKQNDSQALVDAQLWCEQGNKNWVHFQITPPNSGNRWFLP